MILHVLAIRPRSKELDIKAVSSPLQCSAMDYQISFNRAIKIQTPKYKRLIISGTASIDPDGNNIFLSDVQRQADQIIVVISAMLKSQNITPDNLTRVLTYIKRYEDIACCKKRIGEWLAGNSHETLHVHADICRNDLLIEVEADAFILLNYHLKE